MDGSEDKILLENVIIPSFKILRHCVVAYSPQKSIIIGNDFQILEYKGFIIKDILRTSDFLSDRIIDNDTRYLCLYCVDNNCIKWTLDKNVYFLIAHKDIAVCEQDDTDIIAIDINNGTELWQFSISDFPNYINGFFREQEADIKQILGVYDKLLWVHVGGSWLIGIDVETGKLVHRMENIMRGDSKHNFLDTTNGILKTLGYNYYAEFDLKTLQFRKQTTIQNVDNIRIRASNFYEGDKHLYFCGYYNNEFDVPNIFGIFDTEKAEIIWHNTTKDDMGYFYNPPQANDKLLAVLDDKHNLLIYDREDTIAYETTNKNTAPPK
jgi:outer membrane protein assembly factor BamB